MTALRTYQSDLIDALRRSVAAGARRPLVQAPTGSGKSLLMAELTRLAEAKRSRVLILAPRRELIYQTSEKVAEMGVTHGVIMAGEPRTLSQDVQVACIPTLHRRAIQAERMALPPADLLLVDEAHLSIAASTRAVLDAYPDARVVGFTATPARGDGRGLGEVYDDLILGPSVAELTQQGYLVPARYFAGSKPDTAGVKVQAGDYQQGELGRRANTVTLIGDIVSNWCRLAGGRKTVVFAVDRAHSRHLCSAFMEAGIAAEHLDGATEPEDRAAILKRLRSGQTQVICNCEVLTYGWDEPSISCAVMARPTKSIARYLQMIGRVLRPFDDKADCLILDHSGSVHDLGFADDPIPWTLDGKEKVQDRISRERKQSEPMVCDDCGMSFRPAKYCPECGKEHAAKYERAIASVDEDLTEMDRQRKRRNREWSTAEKGRFFGELQGIAKERGYKPGWAANQYRAKMGVWPNAHKHVGALPPSAETRAWVKSQMIRYAKRRAA